MIRRLFICLFAAGILLLPLLFAQHSEPALPERMRVDSLIRQKQYEQAIPLLEQLRSYYRKTNQWADYQVCTSQLAEALDVREDFDQIEKMVTEAIWALDSAAQEQTIQAAKLWQWKAVNLRRMSRYPDAFEAYRTAIRLFEMNAYNGQELAYCYKNAAQILVRWINYAQADDYLKAALQSDTTRKNERSIMAQLAANAYWQDNLETAVQYFQSAQLLKGGSKLTQADLQLTGAMLFARTGKLDEARRLALSALAFHDTMPRNGEHRLRCYTTLADIAARAGESNAAERYFQRAEAEGQTFFEGKKSRELAKLYTEWADFCVQNAQTGRALLFYQIAIVQAFPTFDNQDPAVNPKPEDIPLESWAMRAPARKAMLLLHTTKPDVAARRNAAECFQLSFAAAAELRRVYGADEAKIFLAQYNQNIRREAALNLWALYHELPNRPPGLLAQLFTLLEDTRAAALRDALQQQRALALSGVPDSLLQQEEMLRFQIAEARKVLQDAQETRKSLSIDTARIHVFQCERRHAELLDALQTTNPQLARYVRQTPNVNPATLQAALPDSAALLSWFDAGDRYLCVVARRDGLTAFEVLNDSIFDRRLAGFLARLADRSAQQNAPDDYFAEAFALGECLLPGQLLASVRALVVVPDGRLCYLPFEALLTAGYRGGFGSAPYVLRTHTVRYAWSAALLTTPPARLVAAEKDFLHVAPFVETARDGLAPLPGSRQEQPAGVTVTGLFGKTATAEAFLGKCAQFNVLQLSTHAHAGGTVQPGIELFDRTLTLPEIYAQRLPAVLVALSACETGAGEYTEGEGVLSLARAFAYAGAESLLASHWAVNERSTAELFTRFYEKIENGAPRAEALRQAKLNWLNGPEADARKAPWYWAAFTLSGADGPVDLHRSAGGAWWWVWVAIAGAVGAFFWRRRSHLRRRSG